MNQEAVLGQVFPFGQAVFTDIEGSIGRAVLCNIGGNFTENRRGDGASVPWARQHPITAGGSLQGTLNGQCAPTQTGMRGDCTAPGLNNASET